MLMFRRMRAIALVGIALATSAALTINWLRTSAQQSISRLQVPPGFVVSLYASGLSGPRLMTIGPDGALYVADRGASAIARLTDPTNSGNAQVQVVASG